MADFFYGSGTTFAAALCKFDIHITRWRIIEVRLEKNVRQRLAF